MISISENKGKIYVLIASFVYGLVPILAKIAYMGGASSTTLVFLRSFIMLPVLFAVLKLRRISMILTKNEVKKLIILGTFGATAPVIFIYMSYNYIPAALATSLRFVYPLVIVFVSAVVFKERIPVIKLFSVIVVSIGIIMFADSHMQGSKVGIVLALMSGIFYSFFVVYMQHSGLGEMDYIKLTFYLMVIVSGVSFLFGVLTGELDFYISKSAWFFATVISVLVTLFALPLF